MTATIVKRQPLPVDLPAGEYTDHQINLLVACWQDAAVASKSRTDLALHLYELKQDLDSNDPLAGSNPNGKSRFWSLFEAGALPFQGDTGRRSIFTALEAAEWLTGSELCNPLHNSLRNLAPATIVEIKNLSDDARQVVYRNLESSEFIGVAAVRLLARVSEADTLQRLDQWVDEHQGKALTPASIRKIEETAERSKRQAAAPTHLRPATTTAEPYTPPTITPEQRQARNQELLQEQNIRDTKEALARPDREAADELLRFHKKYSDALGQTVESLAQLRRVLGEIATVKGTIYLDELRDYQGPLGFNYLASDIQELQRAKDLLLEIVKVAVSHEGPQTIEWETINTEGVA